jgi:hypothetical protein
MNGVQSEDEGVAVNGVAAHKEEAVAVRSRAAKERRETIR